jgi:hypothetical protein
MVKFEGKWKYQSYRPDPGSLAADPNPPIFVRWSPPGVVTIDQSARCVLWEPGAGDRLRRPGGRRGTGVPTAEASSPLHQNTATTKQPKL